LKNYPIEKKKITENEQGKKTRPLALEAQLRNSNNTNGKIGTHLPVGGENEEKGTHGQDSVKTAPRKVLPPIHFNNLTCVD